MFVAHFKARATFDRIFHFAFSARLRPQIANIVRPADFARHQVVNDISPPVAAEVFDVHAVFELCRNTSHVTTAIERKTHIGGARDSDRAGSKGAIWQRLGVHRKRRDAKGYDDCRWADSP